MEQACPRLLSCLCPATLQPLYGLMVLNWKYHCVKALKGKYFLWQFFCWTKRSPQIGYFPSGLAQRLPGESRSSLNYWWVCGELWDWGQVGPVGHCDQLVMSAIVQKRSWWWWAGCLLTSFNPVVKHQTGGRLGIEIAYTNWAPSRSAYMWGVLL